MSRFTNLVLTNWRNFGHVEVAVQRRAFLVGPNASGKSNFLDVFRFLHDLVAVGGGLQEAVRRRGGVTSIRSLAARRDPEITIKVDVGESAGASDGAGIWSYELRFGQDNQRRPLVRRELVWRSGELVLERPDVQDRDDPDRMTQTYLEQVYANREFRTLADFLASIRYLHVVPQLVRDPERSLGRKDDPFGGDLLEQVARTPERTRTSRLRRIREVLQVAVPQLMELELDRDEGGAPHLRGKYEHWRSRGAWQTEEQFSDGTLRLLGLLWSLLDGNGPLLLEEPELSLHPEVIRYVPLLFARLQRRADRQLLISTHSRDLLSDPGIGLDEVLLFLPSSEGTVVQTAGDDANIRTLLEGDVPLGEIVTPRTAPPNAYQVAEFGR